MRARWNRLIFLSTNLKLVSPHSHFPIRSFPLNAPSGHTCGSCRTSTSSRSCTHNTSLEPACTLVSTKHAHTCSTTLKNELFNIKVQPHHYFHLAHKTNTKQEGDHTMIALVESPIDHARTASLATRTPSPIGDLPSHSFDPEQESNLLRTPMCQGEFIHYSISFLSMLTSFLSIYPHSFSFRNSCSPT